MRPLRTATGDADFCELFFDDVRVPDSARLGPEGDGWTVAMTTLSFERSGVANLHIPTRRQVRRADRRGPRRPAAPTTRSCARSWPQLYIEAEIQRLLSERATARALQGLPPGPEGSLIKLVWSQVGQELPLVATQILGIGSLGAVRSAYGGPGNDWGYHGRRRPVADHRRRHHRGQQEHRRRARPRACPASPSPT